MAKLEPSELYGIHERCRDNRGALAAEDLASCFYCLTSYPPTEITEYVGDDAVCPKCGVDSVVPSSALETRRGWPKHEVLVAMMGHWFGRPGRELKLDRAEFSIRALQASTHRTACLKGFWDSRPDGTEPSIPEKLMLICCEVAEAMEEWRKGPGHVRYVKDGKPEGIAVELADALIRIVDVAERLNVDLEDVVREKAAFNLTRPYMHGKKA